MFPNKVVISATLHKQIFFVADDDIVRHMGEDLPFTTFVDLPGIQPGNGITITPVVEHVGFELIDKTRHFDDDDSSSSNGTISSSSDDAYDSSDPYVEEHESPLFHRLIQRTVIQLIVRGSQDQAIRIATASLPTTVVTRAAVQ